MKDNSLSFWGASLTNIWMYKQNHPELVVKDIENELKQYDTFEYVDKPAFIKRIQNIVRHSMLIRGINKWLKVRRDLIAYKKNLKHEVRALNEEILASKQLMHRTFVNFDDKPTYSQVHQHYEARANYLIIKTRLKMLAQFRKDLKKMCMTHRWQIWEGKEMSEMNSIMSSD